MRIGTRLSVAAAALFLVVSLGAGAQDQPAAGSPPPDTSAQPQQPAASTAPPQEAPAANAAPDDALPPPPIDMRRGPNPRRQARRLAARLGLAPAQEAQIEPILADRIHRTRAVRKDATLDPRERRTELSEINRDSVRRINAVLTPEQRQQWKQLRQQERAKRMEREQQLQSQPQAQPPVNDQQ